jgi:hypothetical protein
VLSKQLAQMPQGFSSANSGSMPLKPTVQQAGMVAIAKTTLAGQDTKGEVRYVVFSTWHDSETHARDFSMPGSRFFPLLSERGLQL